MSMNPGAKTESPKSTTRALEGTGRRVREVTSAITPSSTRTRGRSIRSSGVYSTAAVQANMVTERERRSFYRKQRSCRIATMADLALRQGAWRHDAIVPLCAWLLQSGKVRCLFTVREWLSLVEHLVRDTVETH